MAFARPPPALRHRAADSRAARPSSIARLYDVNVLADGTPWFAMEYVNGVSLTEHCRCHAVSLAVRLHVLHQVCDAVLHAHRHLIVHRDLKPSNVLVRSDGAVRLLDFGIAKQLTGEAPAADQTRTGLRLMTPAYAAPEQLRGERVGSHTDVYARGVMLYELLTERLPFDVAGLTPAEAETLILAHDPVRPSALARVTATHYDARAVSRGSWADLDVLCLTAMHKDPARRNQQRVAALAVGAALLALAVYVILSIFYGLTSHGLYGLSALFRRPQVIRPPPHAWPPTHPR